MSSRALKWYFGSALMVVLLAVLFAWRPSLVLGVDGDALGNSVNGSGGVLADNPPCEPASDDSWRCPVYDAGASGAYPYRVTADRWGCWEAERIGPSQGEGGTPRSLSGCITLLNH